MQKYLGKTQRSSENWPISDTGRANILKRWGGFFVERYNLRTNNTLPEKICRTHIIHIKQMEYGIIIATTIKYTLFGTLNTCNTLLIHVHVLL